MQFGQGLSLQLSPQTHENESTWNDQNCLRIPTFKRQWWAQILTNLHEPKMDSTLLFNPFQVVYMNFATKNLLACLCSASSTVETISMIFPYLVNFYLQIQNPINLISMSTTYLESSGADLSENELFQWVSILLTGTSTMGCTFSFKKKIMVLLSNSWSSHNHVPLPTATKSDYKGYLLPLSVSLLSCITYVNWLHTPSGSWVVIYGLCSAIFGGHTFNV